MLSIYCAQYNYKVFTQNYLIKAILFWGLGAK